MFDLGFELTSPCLLGIFSSARILFRCGIEVIFSQLFRKWTGSFQLSFFDYAKSKDSISNKRVITCNEKQYHDHQTL